MKLTQRLKSLPITVEHRLAERTRLKLRRAYCTEEILECVLSALQCLAGVNSVNIGSTIGSIVVQHEGSVSACDLLAAALRAVSHDAEFGDPRRLPAASVSCCTVTAPDHRRSCESGNSGLLALVPLVVMAGAGLLLAECEVLLAMLSVIEFGCSLLSLVRQPACKHDEVVASQAQVVYLVVDQNHVGSQIA